MVASSVQRGQRKSHLVRHINKDAIQIKYLDYNFRFSPVFNQFRVYSTLSDNFYYWMGLLSRVDKVDAVDISLEIPKIKVLSMKREELKLLLLTKSSLWGQKKTFYTFRPDSFESYVRVKGKGVINRVYFFMGMLKDVIIGSVPGFDYFSPGCPNFLGKKYFSPNEYFSINVGLETTYWGPALNSGPFFYVFSKEGVKQCFSAGLITQKGENIFQCFDFNYKPKEVLATHDNIVNTQSFSMGYFGNLKVDGEWESPRLVFQFGKDKDDCLKKYCNLLEDRQSIQPAKENRIYRWWKNPIFCGWHEQQALGIKKQKKKLSISIPEGGKCVRAECTQKNHKGWLDILKKHRIPIGTVIIDAEWQKKLATFKIDKEKWPDMRGFVDSCHQEGVKVLLWIQAWSKEGLVKKECIQKDGVSVSMDPTSPKYQRRLEEGIEYMLSTAPDCLNADGLKIDGTATIPVGYKIKTHRDIYGFELQHYYLSIIYRKAKSVKKDALISVYIANPYFRDVCDMVRLGDLYSVYGRPLDTLRERAKVVRISMKNKIIDTDGNFYFSMEEDFLKELQEQVNIGIPTIYQAKNLIQHRVFNNSVLRTLSSSDYRKIKDVLDGYLSMRKREHSWKP